ncbi:MAG: hypothetical protein IJV31_11350 [Clostridia bacterium]|nr:hypothetical protein [Clostridia bacterium]
MNVLLGFMITMLLQGAVQLSTVTTTESSLERAIEASKYDTALNEAKENINEALSKIKLKATEAIVADDEPYVGKEIKKEELNLTEEYEVEYNKEKGIYTITYENKEYNLKVQGSIDFLLDTENSDTSQAGTKYGTITEAKEIKNNN